LFVFLHLLIVFQFLLNVSVFELYCAAQTYVARKGFLDYVKLNLCDHIHRSLELGAWLELSGFGKVVIYELLSDLVAAA
jgi:hypothetical protein